jgi:hypothetical protein
MQSALKQGLHGSSVRISARLLYSNKCSEVGQGISTPIYWYMWADFESAVWWFLVSGICGRIAKQASNISRLRAMNRIES